MITRQNIWNFAQNKPTLIVNDLLQYVSSDVVYDVLLKRGVFKWFAARRKLIKLKNTWKEELKTIQVEKLKAKEDKDYTKYHRLNGYQHAIEKCRNDVRQICHGDRFIAPDFDRSAKAYLRKIENI